MLRRAEALLDPTARPPEAPPIDGLSPFYWHYLRQERWLLGGAVPVRRHDRACWT